MSATVSAVADSAIPLICCWDVVADSVTVNAVDAMVPSVVAPVNVPGTVRGPSSSRTSTRAVFWSGKRRAKEG